MTDLSLSPNRTLLKSVALPTEHGGWGFLLEPIVLGLLVAGSLPGLLFAVAALGVFLLHQPLKLALKDHRQRRRTARTIWAERFALLYGALALAPMVVLLLTRDWIFLWPVVLAVPFASVQLYYEARAQGRRLLPEVCGALALAMIAPALALLAGGAWPAALWLWMLLALRAVSAILYVRARLRLEYGRPVSAFSVWAAHGLGLLVAIGLAAIQAAPWLGVLAFGVLLARAGLGLSRHRQPQSAKIIGFQELAYGLMLAVGLAVGYRLQW
jgi:hypothetical protein